MKRPGSAALERWRGLSSLIVDGVEHGSRAVEKIQLATAGRPFAVLEAIPGLAAPASAVHAIHDAAVAGTHGVIRLVNRVVGKTIDVALDVAHASAGRPPDAGPRDARPAGEP